MEHSEQINELATALAAAQGELENVKKEAENPFYHSKYATLDAVWDTIRPILKKHGLSVIQGAIREKGFIDVGITTMLLHGSGQWISSTLYLPGDASRENKKTGEWITYINAQTVGSAITYARRYGLAAMVGVASEEDTDAQDISTVKPQQKAQEPMKPKSQPPPEDLTEGKKASQKMADKMKADEKIDTDLWALMVDEINKATTKARLTAVYNKIEKRFIEAYPIAKGADEKNTDQIEIY